MDDKKQEVLAEELSNVQDQVEAQADVIDNLIDSNADLAQENQELKDAIITDATTNVDTTNTDTSIVQTDQNTSPNCACKSFYNK